MWGRKSKKEVEETLAAIERAESIIAHVKSQETEVHEKTARLVKRIPRNHFRQSLEETMGAPKFVGEGT